MHDPKWARTALVRARWLFARRIANRQTETPEDGQRGIQAVLEDNATTLTSIPGVVGTALGECSDEPCIKVFVARRTAELLEQVPSTLEGYPVAVEETGEILARDSE
jgi:hypothetical protein